MKTIGIVGGIAWPSTLVYYRRINELYTEANPSVGAPQTPELVLSQTNWALIEEAQRTGQWDELGRILVGQVKKLQAAGADFFILACNTVHMAADYISSHVDIPMIHIIDATAAKLQQGGYRKIGLLGSRYTMTGGYFVGRFRDKFNLEVLIAEGEHQDNVHNALYQEIARGLFLPETREKFKAAMADLVERGAEAIVLGCTELVILVQPEDSTVPIIDTSSAHIEAVVQYACSP